MKRLLSIVLIAAIFVLSACSSPKPEASQKAISVGTRAVKLLDDYLDGAVDYKEVREKLSELQEQMEYASSYTATDKTAEQFADYQVYFKLGLISWDVFKDSYEGDADTYDEIISDRNEIAKLVGIKER